MLYIILECMFLSLVVYLVFMILFYKMTEDYESISTYECGFEPKSIARVAFSYRFFLISILFLIFDVEISLMLPFPFLVNKLISIWLFFLFVMTLILGLMYEYYQGSLDWMDSFIAKA